MIGIYRETWQDIPILMVVDEGYREKKLPVVTYFHGYTSAKEHNLPIAYLLAERGYRVILPDCKLHGEREEDITEEERQLQFFDIVTQNIKDLAIIKQELEQRNINGERFGLAGTSMGGITTAAALTQYQWIDAAAVLMGSPKITDYAKLLVSQMKQQTRDFPISDEQLETIYQSLEQMDLSKQMEKLLDRPLFFWHGEKDGVVPFHQAYEFYEQAISYYKNPENIRFLRELNRGHKVSRFATLETVNWFELQLS